jgi:branched-chain amino acid transport system permease protein
VALSRRYYRHCSLPGIFPKLVLGRGPEYTAAEWIDFLIAGLSQGSLYALIALGYTIVYGVLFMINFAHGEFFMSGTMTATVFVAIPMAASGFLNEHPFGALLVIILTSMTVSVVVALLTERVAYRPLRRAPRLVPLITAIGASFFWQYFFARPLWLRPRPLPAHRRLYRHVDGSWD